MHNSLAGMSKDTSMGSSAYHQTGIDLGSNSLPAEMHEDTPLTEPSSKDSPFAFIGCFFGSVIGAGVAGCTVPMVVNAIGAANPFAACAAAAAVAVPETTIGGCAGYHLGNTWR